MKDKKRRENMIKVDFIKAYDCIDWDFLRMLLHKVSISTQNISWIMGCILTTNFVVIINGFPTRFFRAQRGLRQGCALSPLLFILVMDCLSYTLIMSKNSGILKGVMVTRNIQVTHLMFVDDLLFGVMNDNEDWWIIYKHLRTFTEASCLFMTKVKPILITGDINSPRCRDICNLFEISTVSLEDGFRYLGFHLKDNSYNNKDWTWLLDRFNKKLSGWTQK